MAPSHHASKGKPRKSLRERLRQLADRLTGQRADLAKSRRRYKVFREKAEGLEHRADQAKTKGHSLLAASLNHRAQRAFAKSRYWKERIRRDKKAITKLEKIEDGLEDELRELEKHVHFEGPNKIRGGNYGQRSKAAQARAMLNYRNGTATAGDAYYSMEGGPRDYSHILFHYPSGRVYDCSTYGDGTKYVTGDPSPSGPQGFSAGGYTGTELANCKRVHGDIKVGDLIVYLRYTGDTIGHHVEVVYDPERKRTSGHGDAAINIGADGDYDIFGDGLWVALRPPRERHEHNLPA